MRCIRCNSEILQGASFCTNCGTPVQRTEPMRQILLKCEQCGGTLTTDENRTLLACPYCGSRTLIVENDAVTIERIRTSAQRDIEMERIRSSDRRYQMAVERQQEQDSRNQVEKFKRSKTAKLIGFAFAISVLCTYCCFSDGQLFVGILAVIQAICFGVSWSMGMQIIKEKRKYIHVLIAIVGALLMVPTLRACGTADNNSKEIETIQWSIIDLGDRIPEPKSKKIDIFSNSDEWLSIDVYDMTENDCYAYIQECEDVYGFDVDVEKIGSSFWAYNQKGYKLNIMHLGDYMNIDLKCPVEFGSYELPEYAINAGLPIPESQQGYYEWKYDNNFNIKIGNTTFEEYKAYVELCKEAGFIVDNQDGKDFYNGDNKAGYELSVNYLGYNTMYIDFDSPE